MPYLPIDPNEKTTATPGGTTSQPIAPQTGTGGVGGGGPGHAAASGGSAPTTAGNFTNLTDYLQANSGNNANATAANMAVVNGTAQVSPSRNTDALLQQTYGNTYGANAGHAGNAALDSALTGQGIWGKPTAAPVAGHETAPMLSTGSSVADTLSTGTIKDNAAAGPTGTGARPVNGTLNAGQPNSNGPGVAPSSGGAGHGPPGFSFAHGGEIEPYGNLMRSLKTKKA